MGILSMIKCELTDKRLWLTAGIVVVTLVLVNFILPDSVLNCSWLAWGPADSTQCAVAVAVAISMSLVLGTSCIQTPLAGWCLAALICLMVERSTFLACALVYSILTVATIPLRNHIAPSGGRTSFTTTTTATTTKGGSGGSTKTSSSTSSSSSGSKAASGKVE